MKGKVAVAIALLLAGVLVFGACAAPTPTPELAPEEPTPEPAPPEEVIELTMGHFAPPGHRVHWAKLAVFAERVEEATNGRVHITVYPGGTLTKPLDTYEDLLAGKMDIGWNVLNYSPGVTKQFRLSEVVQLPSLDCPNGLHAALVNHELFTTNPYLKEEWKDIKVLAFESHSPLYLSMVEGKPIGTPDDWEGITICTTGRLNVEWVTMLGGTPLQIPNVEAFGALEKGIVHGMHLPLEGITGFHFDELTYHHTMVPTTHAGPFWLAMNWDSWNGLPKDIQDIMEEESEKFVIYAGLSGEQAHQYSVGKLLGMGHEFIFLTPEEEARWSEVCEQIREEWIAELEAEGLPAREVYNDYCRLLEKYSHYGELFEGYFKPAATP